MRLNVRAIRDNTCIMQLAAGYQRDMRVAVATAVPTRVRSQGRDVVRALHFVSAFTWG